MYYEKKEVYGIAIVCFIIGMLANCYIYDIVFSNNGIQAPHNKIDYKINGSNIILSNASLCRITGISMRPTMFTGNKIIKTEYNEQYLKEGQIIIYKNDDNTTVAHRIKALYSDHLYVQGDNNKGHEKIQYDQIESIIIGVLYN